MTAILAIIDAIGWFGLAGLAVIAGNHLRLVAIHRAAARELLAKPPGIWQPRPDQAYPLVAVQIPVFNEPESVAAALESASALDWPRDRLVIQLLDDSTDETTAIAETAARALREAGIDIQHIRRITRTGFKAGALAEGLSRTDAAFVAILDADHRAPPDWLRRSMSLLVGDPATAFAQFRFEFANADQNALTRMQQLLADSHFVIEQVGRSVAGEPFQFNGTAAVWRRSAIDAAGGWSSDTLAEDLDLVLRVYGQGGRGVLALNPPIRCEAPSDFATWRIQQQRWSKGFSQAALKLLPPLWSGPALLRHKLGASLLLGLQAAFPCALAAIGALVLHVLIAGVSAGVVVLALCCLLAFAGVLVAITYPAYRALGRGSLARYAATVTAAPPMLGLLALSTTPALLRGLFGHGGTFARTPKTGLGRREP